METKLGVRTERIQGVSYPHKGRLVSFFEVGGGNYRVEPLNECNSIKKICATSKLKAT